MSTIVFKYSNGILQWLFGPFISMIPCCGCVFFCWQPPWCQCNLLVQGIICNVAYRRQTKSSSTYTSWSVPSGYSCNAVDGMADQNYFDGSCVHTRSEYNPWWQVDLGAVYTVLYVNLLVRADYPEHLHYGNIMCNCNLFNSDNTYLNIVIM